MDLKTTAEPKWNWITRTSVALSIVIGIAMLTSIVPAVRTYPLADELVYVDPLTSESFIRFIDFVLGAHGDHRIPIQKLVQSLILMWSGFDFRALIAANIILSVTLSVILTLLCWEYRGRSLLGDLLIPLATLPFTASFLFIGFNAQFLSGVFFVSLSSYLLVRSQRSESFTHLYLGIASLIACAMCGLNGAVFALVATAIIGTCAFLFGDSRTRGPTFYYLLAAAGGASLLQGGLWYLSDHVPTASQSLRTTLSFYYNIVGSSLLNFARPDYWWKAAIIIGLLMGGSSLLLRLAVLRKITLADAAIAAPIVGSLFIIAVVTKGRGFEPWGFRFDSHYGYLTVLIPVMSWVVVSTYTPRIFSNIVGVCLVAFFAMSFTYNLRARIIFLDWEGPNYRAIQRDFASSKPSLEIAQEQKNMRYEEVVPVEVINDIARKIDLLRVHGGWQYRDTPADH